MAALSSILLGGGAAAGALSGAIGGASDKVSRREVEVADAGAFEQNLRGEQERLFEELTGLGRASGLGAADVQAAVGAQRGVADILQQLQETSGLPTRQDITRSQDLTSALFAPQREALRQGFEQQGVSARREAARLGRDVNDPILRAKLAQDQTRQSALLEATQGAAAQNLAFQLPTQRLGFAAQRADVLGGLANQAFQNRASLLSIGNQLSQQERAFRVQTATQRDVQEGSLGQALAGGFAGLGQGLSAGAGAVKALGGLGGGGGSLPINRSGFFGGANPELANISQGLRSNDPTASFSTGSGFTQVPSLAPQSVARTQSLGNPSESAVFNFLGGNERRR